MEQILIFENTCNMEIQEDNKIGKGRSVEKYFHMLMNASPDCIKLFGMDNKLEYLSPGGLKEHGFTSFDEAIGFDWTETIAPEQREAVRAKIQECIEKKRTCFD